MVSTLTHWQRHAFPLCLGLFLVGCSRGPAPAPAPAAEKPRLESDLSRTTLTRDEARSLNIRSEPARIKRLQERRRLTGWVMAKPGNEVIVTAPVAGRVLAPETEEAFPLPGKAAGKGKELVRLEPVLGPVEQIQLASLKRGIESELAKAQENVTLGESEVSRIEELHKQKLRGLQDVEQARVRLKIAQEDLKAAQDKKKLFAGFGNGHKPASIPLAATEDAKVMTVHAGPGQFVQAGASLVSLIRFEPLWIRVPVAETDLSRVDRSQPLQVEAPPPGKEAKAKGQVVFEARFKELVPQVDPARHTADLLYEWVGPAPAQIQAKDQMLPVLVPMGQLTEETVVSDAAVIFDAYGGTWIYLDRTPEKAEQHIYERRRVELGPAVDEGLVIRRAALQPGDRVVSFGAAALFSSEFHKPPVAKVK